MIRTLSLFLMLAATPARAELVTCAWPAATDGDSLKCQDGTRIRLDGVDSPEMAQPFGKEARLWLSAALLEREAIQCQSRSRDRYGRLVAICHSGSVELGRWLVRNGMAHDWPAYSRGRYAAEQQAAMRERAGLWQDARPIEPWNWRRGQR